MGSNLSVHYGEDVEDDYLSYEEALGSYIVIIVATIVTFLTLLFALWHIYVSHNINSKLKWHTYALILSLSFNFLSCLRTIVVEHINIMTDNFISCGELPYLPGSVWVGFARLFLYLFYLSRFHNIFKGTTLEFKPKIYKIIIILMFTTVILATINFELIVNISNCAGNLYLAAVGFPAIQDVFWSIFMSFWFIKSLRNVAKHLQQHNSNVSNISPSIDHVGTTNLKTVTSTSIADTNENINKNINENKNEIEITGMESIESNIDRKLKYKRNKKEKKYNKNIELFKVCKKMVIITCTTCISTIIATVLTGWLFNVAVTISVDVIINGICVLFSFRFMEKYFQIFCYPCNFCCKCKNWE